MRLAALGLLPCLAFAAEIDVAREALRDGLWDVAREHAQRADGDDARRVILESYAREGRWDELSGTLTGWRKMDEAAAADGDADRNTPPDAFLYYQALALAEKGEAARAAALLAGADFRTQEYHRLATRLRARLAAESGDGALALRLVRESGFESADAETKMMAAGVFDAAGDRRSAERLWREVAADTNAVGRAFAAAAANLGDAARLRLAAERARDAQTRRFAGLRLGRLLLDKPGTFEEGARLIRTISRDAPDTEGAEEAAIALADALLAREAWRDAAEAFRDILAAWPTAAHRFAVQEGLGWALRRLGRAEEAREAFARAEEAAGGDEDRAMALLEQGDVLADGGRGEEAMAKYRRVLDRFPSTTAAARLKAVVGRREQEAKGRELYRDYRFAEAQAVFAALAASDPAHADRARFLEVLCLYGQGLDGEAEERARTLADGSGDEAIRAEATLWLAKLAYNAGRWAESARRFGAYAEMAADSPRAPEALAWAAQAAFADHDFSQAIRLVTRLVERHPDSRELCRAYAVQGEALMELGRFDEAVLVLERALMAGGAATAEERLQAEVLRADALFALGADNPARYREALDAYRTVRLGEALPPGLRLALSFKVGRTLEKLKRLDEAIDQYYTGVVLAYREGRQRGEPFDDAARTAFARAAFRLADEYESRGRDFQAMHILELVIASDTPASGEAEKRLDRIQMKGKFL